MLSTIFQFGDSYGESSFLQDLLIQIIAVTISGLISVWIVFLTIGKTKKVEIEKNNESAKDKLNFLKLMLESIDEKINLRIENFIDISSRIKKNPYSNLDYFSRTVQIEVVLKELKDQLCYGSYETIIIKKKNKKFKRLEKQKTFIDALDNIQYLYSYDCNIVEDFREHRNQYNSQLQQLEKYWTSFFNYSILNNYEQKNLLLSFLNNRQTPEIVTPEAHSMFKEIGVLITNSFNPELNPAHSELLVLCNSTIREFERLLYLNQSTIEHLEVMKVEINKHNKKIDGLRTILNEELKND